MNLNFNRYIYIDYFLFFFIKESNKRGEEKTGFIYFLTRDNKLIVDI